MSDVKRTVLWSADAVQPNNTSITLNDSIDNYDELIYFGSGTRTYTPCVMTEYPVISGQLNLGGPFFFGNWGATDTFVLCNGTQVFLSGTSGFVASSYYWGKNAGSTAYAAELVNNRANDVRPYMIVGVKYPNNYDKTLIWSSEHTQTLYNTNITLSEPVTHFKEIAVLGSGYETGSVGCRHASKNIYNTQPKVMGCDAWAYTPWKLAEKHNLVIGQEMRLSGNSGYIGSGYFMGMGNQTTAWAAGKWNADYQFSATAPYAIFGVDRKPIHTLTLLPPTGGTQTASDTSGYEYDQITMSNTPDEGWYFSGYNVTGATVNGNVITLQDQDASAQAGFTDEGYPITYLSDEHVHLTGDSIYIPGPEGITLDSGYDTYYRISGYDITGGSIVGGKLVPTGPCTIKAVQKVNYFTATGNFEKGSNQSVAGTATLKKITWGYANVGEKYALHQAHTGDIPSTWYATSNRWKPSNVSSYSITLNAKMQFTGRKNKNYNGATAAMTGVTMVGSTQNQSQTFSVDSTAATTRSYSKTVTTTTQNVFYGVSGRLGAAGYNAGGIARVGTATYIATGTNGTWTATGIAP